MSSCETDLGRSGSSGKSSIRISGGMSFRVGKKFEKELGTNLKKMISLDVDVVADTEHSENISEMFERHVKTPEDCQLVLQGARDSLAVDRGYRGALGYCMERIA